MGGVQLHFRNEGYSSVGRYLLSKWQALGSIHSTPKKRGKCDPTRCRLQGLAVKGLTSSLRYVQKHKVWEWS